jgi:hypothetical protein
MARNAERLPSDDAKRPLARSLARLDARGNQLVEEVADGHRGCGAGDAARSSVGLPRTVLAR